jgi:hypothetical protein
MSNDAIRAMVARRPFWVRLLHRWGLIHRPLPTQVLEVGERRIRLMDEAGNSRGVDVLTEDIAGLLTVTGTEVYVLLVPTPSGTSRFPPIRFEFRGQWCQLLVVGCLEAFSLAKDLAARINLGRPEGSRVKVETLLRR